MAERALHFRVGSEEYCLSIDDVEEVVEEDDPAVLPKSPDHVLGVQDYRDETLEVIDAAKAFGIDGEVETEEYVLVLDESFKRNDRYIAWVIDEVYEVLQITEDDLDDSVSDEGVKSGVRKEDEGLVIWLDADELIEQNTDY